MDMVYSLVSRTGQWAWTWYAVTGRSLPRVAIETMHATSAVVTLRVVLAVLQKGIMKHFCNSFL